MSGSIQRIVPIGQSGFAWTVEIVASQPDEDGTPAVTFTGWSAPVF